MRYPRDIDWREFQNSFVDKTLRKGIDHHYSIDTNVLVHTLGLHLEYEKLTIGSTRKECGEWLKHARVSVYHPILREFYILIQAFRKSYNSELDKLKKEFDNISTSFSKLENLKNVRRISRSEYKRRKNSLRDRLKSSKEEKKRLKTCEGIAKREEIFTLKEILDRPNFRLVAIKEGLIKLKELDSSLFSELKKELNNRKIDSVNDLALICLSAYEDATIVTFDYPLMRLASKYGVKCHNPWEKLPYEFKGKWE